LAGDTVIADAGSTLLKLLQEHMVDMINPSSIGLQSPAELTGPNTRLTLFLYNIMENPFMSNQESRSWGTGQLQAPPLVLDLYFMLTAHSSVQDLTERTLEEHRILGRAMKVMYDHSIIEGPDLQGGLTAGDEKLRIKLNSLSLSELSEIWSSFSDHNLKPSVCYVVSPVSIESERISDANRVTQRMVTLDPINPRS
jgi:hypothetical protein